MTKSNNTSKSHSQELEQSELSRASQVLLSLISWYQKARAGRIAPCRFYPSCSSYAYEAVEVHGVIRGLGLALRRISKCRPLGPHGIDLVPVVKKDRSSTL
ncbi:MAG: membrane protein insertion efficiency factor YidD [Acidimicrobiaceae bacterium]|nr:membrane protein insertion efficiency factor YidD [Acidimicrobiaceae bacterium]